ncbi:hypothetical protein [Streptomyces sp. AC550_RSS872]|uniref:hypothetical protein n=1 Tax=Streptomyces sp. AC550_RSS872 TaxID=2823689 RepID=UPI001C2592E4|nr:hypothetical protein [Streptomyces sp. AC550_RSS872]
MTSFARPRPVTRLEAPLLVLTTQVAAAPADRGLSAGPAAVGALAFAHWMPGRLRSRRHEPHSAEV